MRGAGGEQMTIEIDHDYHDIILPDYRKIIENVILAALDHEKCPYQAQVYVRLTDDEEIHQINRDFRGIDRPTDVLSFPASEYEKPGDFSCLEEAGDAFDPGSGELLLGDIIISMDRVISQAEEYGHARTRELAFLTAHSMLHLMGYDHMVEEEARQMEKRQEEILASCSYLRSVEERAYDIIIIGAGPAGMTAALSCSRDSRVLLLEKQEIPGRKILVTGNGRCNLTNRNQNPSCYRSEDPEAAMRILGGQAAETTIAFMAAMGVYTRDKDGYIYPYNEQAKTVREAFEREIDSRDNISFIGSCPVTGLLREGESYLVESERGSFRAASVILAGGGLAGGDQLGCDGSCYRLAAGLGERLIPPGPSLTALKSGAPFLKRLAGVRCQAGLSLYCDDKFTIREDGQLQWTDYGISGIAVFNISRYAITALEEGKKVRVCINFLPDLEEKEADRVFSDMSENMKKRTAGDFLKAFVHEKLVEVLLHESGISGDSLLADIADKDLMKLRRVLASFEVRISGYAGYEKAQVTRGGVALSGLSDCLESRQNRGLFFAGELIDVDGACGGYNLQWAFSSGMAAGRAASARRPEG